MIGIAKYLLSVSDYDKQIRVYFWLIRHWKLKYRIALQTLLLWAPEGDRPEASFWAFGLFLYRLLYGCLSSVCCLLIWTEQSAYWLLPWQLVAFTLLNLEVPSRFFPCIHSALGWISKTQLLSNIPVNVKLCPTLLHHERTGFAVVARDLFSFAVRMFKYHLRYHIYD